MRYLLYLFAGTLLAAHDLYLMPAHFQVLVSPRPNYRSSPVWASNGSMQVTIVGRTDRFGRILIPLRRGLCRLSTVRMEPAPDRKTADWASYWTTLTFEKR